MNSNKNKVNKNPQFTKVQITQNNPLEFDMSHDNISKALRDLKSLQYYIMGDEIGGKDGTYHTHVYAVFSAPVRFSTLKKRFPSAHIEKAISTHSSNIAYVEKSGKWAHSEKGLTTVPNTLEEYGTRPTDSNGSNALLCELYELIKDGKSNFEILEANADLIKYFDKFDRIRLTLNTEKYKKCWRDLEVTYIFGKTGAGKSRFVMETYGYENVFRVTDYTHAWDTYEGQDIVVLEEYASSFQIQKLLNYLDGYPLKLKQGIRIKQHVIQSCILFRILVLRNSTQMCVMNREKCGMHFFAESTKLFTLKILIPSFTMIVFRSISIEIM